MLSLNVVIPNIALDDGKEDFKVKLHRLHPTFSAMLPDRDRLLIIIAIYRERLLIITVMYSMWTS
jgi:hypothetical protein